MLIEIQKTIPNVPYSVNKQSFEVNEETTPEQMKKLVSLAKLVADEVDRQWQNQVALDPQTEDENKMLRKANEQLDLVSAQKSVIIEALKREIGDGKYAEIRERTVNSSQFKSLTLHANEEN